MSFRSRPPFGAARMTLGVCASALITACASTSPAEKSPPPAQAAATPAPAPTAPAAPKPHYGSFGVDTPGMDTSVAPGDDFYRYVNGKWADTTEIPPDRSSYGMFSRLSDDASQQTRELLEAAAKSDAPAGSEERKLGDYYASFIDEAAIEARGATPLKPELDRIAAVANRKDLASLLGTTLRSDVDPLNTGQATTERLLGLWVAEDLNDPSRYAAYLLQGGLGLPDRDFYLKDTPRFKEVREKYQQHIATQLKNAGIPGAEAKAGAIFGLEKKIAQAHWAAQDTQDVAKVNNPWKQADFAKKAPGMDWAAYFASAGLTSQKDFIAWQPSAITGIAKLVGSEPLQTWKDYLAFHAILRGASVLSKPFVDASFDFNGRTMSGAQQLRPRWKRGVDFTNGAMGEAVGKRYVDKHFPPAAKAEADVMVRNILAALGRHIDALAWMSPETKARAKEKLGTVQVGIGHPDTWRDYSGLEIVKGDAFGNEERSELFEHKRNLAKLGKPVDRKEWFMAPQEVNALNSPQQNSIIFPAAILQPPFFDPNADPAVNYAGIGSVIGHEIVHSFDDVGAQFDAKGKLSNWWTPKDLEQFKAAGKALAAQYDAYKPLPDMNVNGELTLGENIADVAGVSIAHDAYVMSLEGQPAPTLDGFTGEQRFFLGFAQAWRNKFREPLLRRLLVTDGHSPGMFRAATVRNLDAWYPAFDVKPGQGLYLKPEQRVKVW
ncbi:M13 family metallopeptidase [Corallococcus carmarthensis]|uniref:M13 family peptidase n=1 Tax=Corallococcus carmarthensis TaxID=2316728 RepID=A0A3A8KDU0_9BACT|nr:M13 family metallopeptidase [Corallococcus carmarthensis]RKH05706.1 M13 family peptidase [Corallococcus carmarthensis]